MLIDMKTAIDELCRQLTQKLLLCIPGSVGASASVDRFDSTTHHVKMEVDFTNGRRSQVIVEWKMQAFGDIVEVDAFPVLVENLIGFAVNAFREKVTPDEAQLWRATKAEAREAIAAADDAFAGVERTVG